MRASAPEPTEELIQSAKAGDMDAWGQLDKRYRLALSLFMRGKIPTSARRRFDTEDVLQSAFLSAFKELDSYRYRGEGSFLAWMTRILQNRLTSRVRKDQASKRDGARNERYTDNMSQLADSLLAESPSELFSTAENQARLLQALTDLDEKERDVITLYFFDKKSMGQIADELGISPTTVNRRLQSAIKTILLKMK